MKNRFNSSAEKISPEVVSESVMTVTQVVASHYTEVSRVEPKSEAVEKGVFGNFDLSDPNLPKTRLERSRFESGGRLRVELNERLWRCGRLCRRGGYFCDPFTSDHA